MKHIAIILAAGSGTRLGGDKPKQFLEVGGKTILEHTVGAFARHDGIDEIAVVTRADYVDEVRRLTARCTKVRHVVEGGKERYHSTLAALNLYTDDDDILLFHDCVRPLVSQRIIGDCIEALRTHAAIGVGVPATDTIWQTTADHCIAAIPPRATLVNAQTPQGFRRSVIRRAYDLALADPSFVSTDDCGVVRRYLPDTPIHIVAGEPTNIKITYKADLLLLRELAEVSGS
ncbi:MAG: 2-C-methyl-D-erythritol 4-phosphate cytidylyltransferase [Bacteroidaceae bacterium]|nr:2-C-methyl-D-erythritol 4-phosphate cytidylyltransferase [Bacteroidaceae bacterium]